MKVLFINKSASSFGGGRNQYVLDIAGRLQKAGARVALMHARKPASEFRGTGYVFNHLDTGSAASPMVLDKLGAILEDFSPDIIQLHGMHNFKLLPALQQRAPVVQFVHNHAFNCSGDEMTWMFPRGICERLHARTCLLNHALHRCGSANPVRNLLRFSQVSASLESLKALDGIQVANPVIGANLVRNGIPAELIEHIPLYAPEPAAQPRSLKHTRRILLHPGGLVSNKGVWLLLNGLHKLPPDVELIFAGGGSLQDRVEHWIKSRQLGERVRVMGELTPQAWSELYNQCTLVLFPSRWNEPLGLAGLHAMAHGKPVVAFEVGGVTDWLKDRVNGRLVKFNDPNAYFETVNNLLSDPNECRRMGNDAAGLWSVQHNPARHVERLLSCYKRLVAQRE